MLNRCVYYVIGLCMCVFIILCIFYVFQVIKLYAWEIPFQRLIMGIRNKEVNVLKKTAYLNAAITFTFTCAPFMVSTIEVYVSQDYNNVISSCELIFNCIFKATCV